MSPSQIMNLGGRFATFVNELLRLEVAAAGLVGGHVTTTYRVTDDARTREFTVQPQPPRSAEDQQPTIAGAPLIPPALGAVKETALLALRDLAKSLNARGFTVRLDPDDWTLIARNEATASSCSAVCLIPVQASRSTTR